MHQNNAWEDQAAAFDRVIDVAYGITQGQDTPADRADLEAYWDAYEAARTDAFGPVGPTGYFGEHVGGAES
jgi:hypothetical protein